MHDLIALEGLRIDAPIGVYPHEKGVLQRLLVDVRLYTSIREAARTDDVAATLDYDEVARLVTEVASSRHHQLIETVAEAVAARILTAHAGRVSAVRVRVSKPGAVPAAGNVWVEIERHAPDGT